MNNKVPKELDIVMLKDGRIGTILNKESNEEFLIEVTTSDGWDLIYINIKDIEEIAWKMSDEFRVNVINVMTNLRFLPYITFPCRKVDEK